MSLSLKKLWNDYGIGVILILLIVAYGISLFAGYLTNKGRTGYEPNKQMSTQYKQNGNSVGVQPANPMGENEVFADANGTQTSMPGLPSSCSAPNIQNPDDLLPRHK